jgi:hypothetical protein
MKRKKKMERDADGFTHSPPGSVTQQSEDSFPASDSPTFSPGAVGAPVDRHTPAVKPEEAVQKGEEKVDKALKDKKPVA